MRFMLAKRAAKQMVNFLRHRQELKRNTPQNPFFRSNTTQSTSVGKTMEPLISETQRPPLHHAIPEEQKESEEDHSRSLAYNNFVLPKILKAERHLTKGANHQLRMSGNEGIAAYYTAAVGRHARGRKELPIKIEDLESILEVNTKRDDDDENHPMSERSEVEYGGVD